MTTGDGVVACSKLLRRHPLSGAAHREGHASRGPKAEPSGHPTMGPPYIRAVSRWQHLWVNSCEPGRHCW